MKIGIIGNGFVGGHLANNLLLSQINFVIFSKEDFENDLFNSNDFHQCTHVFLLAGINRHQDDDFILNENLRIVEKFCNSLKKLKTKFPHIFFSSSVQEKSNSTYGIAKKKCRQYLEMKSSEIGFGFTSFIIPNVFDMCVIETSLVFSLSISSKYAMSIVPSWCIGIIFKTIPFLSTKSCQGTIFE